MIVTETPLKGAYLLEPTVFTDQRGAFFESYNKQVFEQYLGQKIDFVQDNHSVSDKGTLRGLHFQQSPHEQAKLVRVVCGEVLDVIVDIRTGSPTFGQHFKVLLSETNRKMLFIPRGMAHGFLSLKDNTIFVYKCDNYYDPDAERGILFNDPQLHIDWEYSEEEMILSDRDKKLPPFSALNP